MSASLVGSEMCIRDRRMPHDDPHLRGGRHADLVAWLGLRVDARAMGPVARDGEGVVGLLDGAEAGYPQAVAGVPLPEGRLELGERRSALLFLPELHLLLVERPRRALVVGPAPLEGVVAQGLLLGLSPRYRGVRGKRTPTPMGTPLA
eukprot:6879375-Alexandrium_andersonii.AAC.1